MVNSIFLEEYNENITIMESLKNINFSLNDEILSESLFKNVKSSVVQFEFGIKKIEKDLDKNGIDTKSVKNITDKYAVKLKNLIGNYKAIESPKELENSSKAPDITPITRMFANMFDEIFNLLRFDEKKNTLGDKLLKSLIILLIVFVINSVIARLFFLLTKNFIIAMILTAIFIAPITEEIAKAISVKLGFGKEYYLVFNAFEFTQYISKLTKEGAKLSVAIFVRTFALIMHGINHLIIKAGYDKDKKNGMDDKQAGNLAMVTTMIIHACYNSFLGIVLIKSIASIFNIDLSSLGM